MANMGENMVSDSVHPGDIGVFYKFGCLSLSLSSLVSFFQLWHYWQVVPKVSHHLSSLRFLCPPSHAIKTKS